MPRICLRGRGCWLDRPILGNDEYTENKGGSWYIIVGFLPIDVSTPFTEKRSLIEMGRPCNGPKVVPVFARYSSICFAVAKASSKKISVQQVVSWCASAARLANARVNSSEDSSAEESLRRRTVISVSSVSASSAGVSMRRIYARASGCESAEGTGDSRHSAGMRAS